MCVIKAVTLLAEGENVASLPSARHRVSERPICKALQQGDLAPSRDSKTKLNVVHESSGCRT